MGAETELEKQYKDYKAQFEEWKEKNKNATGTDAYKAYVKQFESWEKDVEKRRKMIKEKADQEVEVDKIRNAREEQAREEMERQEREHESIRQAQAYADEHASYMSHHVAAMEAESRKSKQRLGQPVAQPQPLMSQIIAPPIGLTITQHNEVSTRDGDASTDVVMKEMLSIVMGGATAALGGVDAPVVGQAPPESRPSTAAPPPQLWGNTKIEYTPKDPLFAKWGPRAAPAHCYMPPPPGVGSTPCWMIIEETSKRKMMLAPTAPPIQMNDPSIQPIFIPN